MGTGSDICRPQSGNSRKAGANFITNAEGNLIVDRTGGDTPAPVRLMALYRKKSMNKTDKIYMPLLDEGTPVWRPVMAARLDQERFVIISNNINPEDEEWQFSSGDTVRCEMKELMHDEIKIIALVAVEKI